MSGGHLVVTDRAGRDVKRYSLPSGLVTIGSDSTCDIRVMLPAVFSHHATVVVRANQTVIRNVCDGETLVNGAPVSVATLNHGDTITLGDRSLRWEYAQPEAVKPVPTQTALYVKKGRPKGRGRKRVSEIPPKGEPDPALQLMLEMRHRHSMPGAGKQVAVVQPQRRDTHDNVDTNPRLVVKPHRPYAPPKRQRTSTTPKQDLGEKAEDKKRKSTPKATPNKMEQTKASLWIESRKSDRMKSVSPKKTPKADTPKQATPKPATPKQTTAKATPKQATPKVTPRQVTPKQATPKLASPRQATPKVTPKQATPKLATPEQATPKQSTPKTVPSRSTPKQATPKSVTPKSTPKRATPKQATPKTVTPRSTPKRVSSIQSTPKQATPKTVTPKIVTPKRSSLPRKLAAKPTPLRTLVLRKAVTPNFRNIKDYTPRKTQSVTKVAKIQAPLTIDYTKQAALMLMARHTQKPSLDPSPVTPKTTPTQKGRKTVTPKSTPKVRKSSGRNPKSRSSLQSNNSSFSQTCTSFEYASTSQIKRGSSIASLSDNSSFFDSKSRRSTIKSLVETPQNNTRRSQSLAVVELPQNRRSRSATTSGSSPKVSPKRTSASVSPKRASSRISAGESSVSVIDISDTDRHSRQSKRNSTRSSLTSPTLLSPKKSSMKNPHAKTTRKTESIKFDLSNLENSEDESTDVFVVSNVTKKSNNASYDSDDDVTLQYSDASQTSLSPRRSIYSRSSKILQRTLGSTIDFVETSTLTPQSPSARKSIRGSLIVAKALSTPEKSTYSTRTTKSVDSNRSGTTSPRAPKRKFESYSIVDLVSVNDSISEYGSIGSASTAFGTPQSARKTRSTIGSALVETSTPFPKGRQSRSSTVTKSSSDTFVSEKNSPPSKRSKSTGSDGRQSRATRRNDSDVLIISTRSLSDSPRNMSNRKSDSPKNASNRKLDSPKNASNRKLDSPKNASNRKSDSPKNTSNRKSSRSPKNTSNRKSKDSPKNTSNRISKSLTLNISSASSKSNQSVNETRTLSPKQTSRRSSRKTGSPASPEDGMHTPEQQTSPQEFGTPVINMQSLLNASNISRTSKRSPVSANLKRKTIGARASTAKATSSKGRSKSLNMSAAKRVLRRLSKESSNASDKTDEGVLKPSNDETITPKTTVKIVPEAVKGKHSTAKKPVSKRSIIDELNNSDIVKQLFASPVKRKLSKSMTEYAKSPQEPVRKTRNTIALTGRSTDNSLLDNSDRFTPEVFVSPLNTPEASPNLSGIKRLYRRNTPQNDLSNVKGVKALLRTPRARKSVKNDLTNVSGVKNVFAKSPRNRLSDLKGVKAVLAATATSPKNDLRRVSGVKSLFQSEKKRKQPKNDLSNISGVKRLFRHTKSPRNDLTNPRGVKETLTKSPRNDLRDVRGVKLMFTREQSRNGLSDLSGVEELFNQSYDSHTNASRTDAIFDQLVGKPVIKATYAKSFNKSAKKTQTKRNAKSLNKSIEGITNNVEEWIEKELQQRLHKNEKSKSKTPKPNRELQKLQTDTVEGTTPMQSARARNSSIKIPQKSASEIYSARKLPLKKRSLAEKSIENHDKSVLPIKKRALVHSTPVKGRFDMTANVSELGRVSPIVPDRRDLEDNDTGVPQPKSPKSKPAPNRKTATPKQKPASPKKKPVSPKKPPTPKAKRNTRVSKPIGQKEIEEELISKPVRSRNTKAKSPKTPADSPKVVSPVKSRATRAKKPETKNVKKLKDTVVITKKSPIMSPQPEKTRGRRAKEVLETVATPKKTRKVIEKVSPKKKVVSPKKKVAPKKKVVSFNESAKKVVTPKKNANKASPKKAAITVEKVKTPRKGRRAAEKVVSPKKNTKKVAAKASPKKTSKKMTKKQVTPQQSPKKETPKKNTRTKKAVTPKASPKKVTPKKNPRKQAEKVVTPKTSPIKPRRGRKVQEKPATPNIKVKKTTIAIVKPSPQMKPEKPKRGQKSTTTTIIEKVQELPKRGRKLAKTVSLEKPKTTPEAKNKANVTDVPKGRKRKITEVEIPEKAPKRGRPDPENVKATKGKKTVVETVTETRRQKKSTVSKEVQITKTTKTKVLTEKVSPKTRGKKAQNTTVEAPAARGRKRKSEEPPSPKKGSASKGPPAAKKSRAAPKVSPPSPPKRATRQKADTQAAPARRRR